MNLLRSRWAIAALFVLLAAGMVVPAVYLLARGGSNAEILVIPPSGGPTPVNPSQVAPRSDAPVEILVYVNGAVDRPGVYGLFPGARIVDVVEAAGGPTADADLAAINLALRVTDEGYYYVPRQGEVPPSISSPAGPSSGGAQPAGEAAAGLGSGASPGLINLNTAGPQQLASLPSIGQVRAQAIVDHRAMHGPFATTEGITDVHGIGDGIYVQVRNLVTVDSP